MSGADDPAGASLDPRTWRKPAGEAAPTPAPERTEAAPGPAPGPEATSFDPKSWSAQAAPAPAAAAHASRKPPVALIGAAVVALAVAGGAGAMLMRRPAEPAAEAPATPTPQATAPAAAPLAALEIRTLAVGGPDQIAPALTAFGVAPNEAAAAAEAAAGALAGAGELRLEARVAGAALQGLRALKADGNGVELARAADGGFTATPIAADVRMEVRVARGELDGDSFYSSAVAAGLNDALIPAFAQAFTFDFDFQRELKQGDVFEAVYEEAVNADGTPAASGTRRLLYARLATAAKSRELYRFTPPGDPEEGWFDGAGRSVVRSIMRTPVDGARISSKFGPRMHPIRGYVKNHNGTDFAAPQGTKIYAASNGVVEFAAMKGCNGNFTILRHDNPANWQTYYLHQVRFAEGIAAGTRVTQGQPIGEVGTTGCSTGPHLHYEVRIDGQPVDPMTIQVSEGRALADAALAAFVKVRDSIDQRRREAL